MLAPGVPFLLSLSLKLTKMAQITHLCGNLYRGLCTVGSAGLGSLQLFGVLLLSVVTTSLKPSLCSAMRKGTALLSPELCFDLTSFSLNVYHVLESPPLLWHKITGLQLNGLGGTR